MEELQITDSNYTHLLTIVDRSGSMALIVDDMIGALNTFFEGQAEVEGKCLVDYAQFDSSFEWAYQDKDISEAEAVLRPRGGTALNDAIGKAVTDFGEKLNKMKEADRPGNVIVVVVTDGGENASTEWTVEGVKKLVTEQEEKYNWDFTFLGANMDAVATGTAYGFRAGSSITYDTANTESVMASMGEYVMSTRSGLRSAYSDEQRKSAVQ